MFAFCSKFIPNLASLTHPLRELTKKNSQWNWSSLQETAWTAIKSTLSEKCHLAYFRPSWSTQLFVDAGPVGLGAVLCQTSPDLQQFSIIAFASRSLTPVETRYSQFEREALAMVWAIIHFHLYLLGSNFQIVTDNKSLQQSWMNPSRQLSPRLERWLTRIQGYCFEVIHQPGHSNPADYLSKQPTTLSIPQNKIHDLQKTTEEYLNFLTQALTPKALTVAEIATATKEDNTLQRVRQCLQTNSWPTKSVPELMVFRQVSQELSWDATNEILLKGSKLVIPESLRWRTIDLAHLGHQGMTRTKALLRTKVWFPRIDEMVADAITRCHPCASVTPQHVPCPIQHSPLPAGVWEEVSMDFAGPFPTGEYILVLVDDFSRFLVLDILHSTSAKAVIPSLRKIFGIFGIPGTVKTDNGPPFQSSDFHNFAEELGFHHRKIIPEWPRANGEAERFIQTLLKVIHSTSVTGKSWKEELVTFVTQYRSTPHCVSGAIPSTLMFGRTIRTKLPAIRQTTEADHRQMAEYQSRRQQGRRQDWRQEAVGMNKDHHHRFQLNPGDTVLIKQKRKNKLTPLYDPVPFQVTKVKGVQIIAKRGSQQICRHRSFFKWVRPDLGDHSQPQHHFMQPPSNDFEDDMGKSITDARPSHTDAAGDLTGNDVDKSLTEERPSSSDADKESTVPGNPPTERESESADDPCPGEDHPQGPSGEPAPEQPCFPGRPPRLRRQPLHLKDYVAR